MVVNRKQGVCRNCAKIHPYWTKSCMVVVFPEEIILGDQEMAELDPEYPEHLTVPWRLALRPNAGSDGLQIG